MLRNVPRWMRSAAMAGSAVPLIVLGVLDGAPSPRPFGPASPLELRSRLLIKAAGGWDRMAANPAVVIRHFPDVVQIDLVPNSDVPRFNGVQSSRGYDFTGQAWHLRADVSRLRLQSGLEAKFRVTRSHQTDYVSVELGEGVFLRFLHKFGGELRRDSITFDPVRHAWLRLRHEPSDDTMRWETSHDGREWTERWRDARRFDIEWVKAEVYAGTYMPLDDPGSMRFTDFGAASSE